MCTRTSDIAGVTIGSSVTLACILLFAYWMSHWLLVGVEGGSETKIHWVSTLEAGIH